MSRFTHVASCVVLGLWATGCATQKESFTARTGVEQLLISSAVDRSLDNVDFAPMRGKQVFLDSKYLDCVDKNYVLLAMRHRIMLTGATLLDKADKADIVVEVASGGVGTDAQELFVGVPEIPLAPPSPIAIPKLSLLTRTKLNGTAKILVVAYDAQSKRPISSTGMTLARSDQNNWNVLCMGPVQTGSLPTEIAATTKDKELGVTTAIHLATGAYDAAPPRFYHTAASGSTSNDVATSFSTGDTSPASSATIPNARFATPSVFLPPGIQICN